MAAGEVRDTVALEAVKPAGSRQSLEATAVDTSRDGGVLSATVDAEESGLTGPTPRVDLDLAVPADLRVQRVGTVNGIVDAEGVFGPLPVRSTNGAVTLTGINGDVEVDGVDGDVRVGTTNGDIRVRSVAADTTNGGLSVTDADGTVTT